MPSNETMMEWQRQCGAEQERKHKECSYNDHKCHKKAAQGGRCKKHHREWVDSCRRGAFDCGIGGW